MSANGDLITEFCASWPAMDLERILAFFSEAAVYTNIPIDPPNEGIAAIRKAIEGFMGMAKSIEFVVHHQAENAEGIVMNERTDRFEVGDRVVEARVMGVFEVEDGKIRAWRDYFDLEQFMKAFRGEG